MGNLSVNNDESNASSYNSQISSYFGHPLGLGFGGKFDFCFGMRRGIGALRNVDEGDWWRFPTVDVLAISPKFNKVKVEKKKKKVLNAWSDRGSPFSDEIPSSELPENDVHARLAQIDLFSEGGGLREASVLRYKEKRRTRLFSKKIRYQVRKVNADRRPRMKGRFVRRPNSPGMRRRWFPLGDATCWICEDLFSCCYFPYLPLIGVAV
ncbi:hypothetical protein F0562_009122 [Nyssa sinensis]|uniref:CCT domain-containing protein n=1 Tax=Nyssa sinensis TaxID=561372 RepID=A0A5J4ZY13_9ASTE|nr:hypothetical protein F0562_009122 [Nyssa sinensis]